MRIEGKFFLSVLISLERLFSIHSPMASAEVSTSPALGDGEGGMSPGEFVLKKIFAEFIAVSDRKLQHIATQRLVRGREVTHSNHEN